VSAECPRNAVHRSFAGPLDPNRDCTVGAGNGHGANQIDAVAVVGDQRDNGPRATYNAAQRNSRVSGADCQVKQFAASGDWAIASDGVQWILQRRRSKRGHTAWRAISFVRSTKDILDRCMREKDVPVDTARQLLAGLPERFDDWLPAGLSRLPGPPAGRALNGKKLMGPAPNNLGAALLDAWYPEVARNGNRDDALPKAVIEARRPLDEGGAQ
jgi:hypothetical protein